MRTFLVASAVLVVGCMDPCPSAAAAGVSGFASVLYKRPAGLSINAYGMSAPSAAGLVVGNGCDPPGSAGQFETAACAATVGDDGCTACLKAHCCLPTLEWLDGAADAGPGAFACADANCTAACTRSK